MKPKTKNNEVNQDIDEQNEGVSYEKGREFEEQFAKFMKQELNWEKVRVGAHMTGKNNAKGTTIDIFGMRLDELGIKYKKVAIKWGISSGITMIFTIIWWIEKWGEHGHWFFLLTLFSLLGAVIFGLLAVINNQQNAWVECKNLKSKVNINHISKMIREYKDFKASKNEEYRFTHLYFVSANGYIENALKMALDNNVICYTKKGNSFIEEKYFNV